MGARLGGGDQGCPVCRLPCWGLIDYWRKQEIDKSTSELGNSALQSLTDRTCHERISKGTNDLNKCHHLAAPYRTVTWKTADDTNGVAEGNVVSWLLCGTTERDVRR